MWVLTRNRPTGPRRGTAILILGAISVLLAGMMIAVHFWVASTNAGAVVVLLARIGALVVPLAWAAFVVAGYREERRAGVRTYAASAGLGLLVLGTVGGIVA